MAKEIPFRSITDLKGYNDDTRILEPSMTDPEQDEPISRLVQRLIRGEMVETRSVVYDDIRPEMPLGEAFEQQNVTTRDGFDLADAPAILDAANRAIEASATPSPAPEPEAKETPPPAEPPADGK